MFFLFGLGPLPAQEPAPATLYDEGVRALAEGLPPVATLKLRAFLHLDLTPDQRRAGILALVRALLAQPDAAGALAALDAGLPPGSPEAPADPEAAFWRGQVDAALGRWEDALASYTRVAQAPAAPGADDLRAQARFGQGECFLVLDRRTEAVDVLTPLCAHPLLGEAARLRCAEIALSRGRLDDAARLLRTDGAFDPAEAAARRGRHQERAYLLGRLRLAQHQPVQAEAAFSAALARPEGLSERLLVDLSWGQAQARLDQGKLDTAEDALEYLVEHHPRIEHPPDRAFLTRTFSWLEALYQRDPQPDLSDVRHWTEDDKEPDRQALALLTLGRVQARPGGDTDQAEAMFERLAAGFPANRLRVRALVELAALRLGQSRPAEARAALDQARARLAGAGRLATPAAPGLAPGEPGVTLRAGTSTPWRTEMDVLDARISLAENNQAQAAAGFMAVADRLGTGPQAEAAAFNAVLCSLRAVDTPRYTAAEADFRARFPGSPLTTEFALEEGLARAREAQPGDRVSRQRAAACLRGFLRDHPGHARAPEARIALAELAFERARPDLDIAWHELDAPGLRPVGNEQAASPPAPEEERARAEYLAIWLADAPGPARDQNKAVALAKRFLADRPDSPLAAEVRMKLGGIYFQQADYPDAQTQLELLAENAPGSPLAESALYLAGLSAASSMSPAGLERAAALFESVAARGGPLRLAAPLREADVQNQLNRSEKALQLYNGVLKATGDVAILSDADLDARCAALSGRGRTLLLLAAGDPKLYAEAVRTFDQLRNTPGASLLWRRQALTQKGDVLEKMGETDAALAAYDDALNTPEPTAASVGGSANAPDVPEWTWFYRAGYAAGKLLEAREQWTAAIAIYKKVAAADGPMKIEFENLLGKRRLEHFIWEE